MFSVWWRWDRLKVQHIAFCLKWNEQWCQYSCASVYWTKSQWTTKPDWFRPKASGQQNLTFFTSIRGWSLFTCYFSALWKGDKCSWDIFLWNNSGRHQSFMSFSNLFQLCTHARIMMGRSHERLRFVRRIFVKKLWRTLHSHEFFQNISTLYPC